MLEEGIAEEKLKGGLVYVFPPDRFVMYNSHGSVLDVEKRGVP